jgi:uncharacterized protein (TIGR02996 family)
MSEPDPLREALEAALVEAPDDAAAHAAYADYLSEQGDPRGEFIQVQLALQKPLTREERKRLKAREEELLAAHERDWLGDLAPLLLATPDEQVALFRAESRWWVNPQDIAYSWTNGWLDHLECDYLTVEMARKLGRAPIARLLHTLVWRSRMYAYQFDFSDGPDIPQGVDYIQPWEVLAHYPAIRNVRVFQFGEEVDPEEWEYRAGTTFLRLTPLIERMPRLEELSIFAYVNNQDMGRSELGRLFALPTLTNLRVLRYYHGHAYPLEALAANPALGRLTHLLCHPHKHARREPARRGQSGWASAITHPGVYTVVTSPHLKSLTHLQIRCCDGGDDMVADIVDSGVLKRLKTLDLRHGRITDVGARQLAAYPEIKGLELDLVNNRLTTRGIAALQVAGCRLRAEDQQRQPYDTNAMFWGDTE